MTDYQLMIKQMEALAEASSDMIAVMANVSAIIYHSMEDINWAGFYIVKADSLLLGPFQGKVACVRIDKGRGVCGTAWEENRTQLVKDVHAFEGHFACDPESRSEIVVPVRKDNEVIAVLDIDSPKTARFTEPDAKGLELLAARLETIIK